MQYVLVWLIVGVAAFLAGRMLSRRAFGKGRCDKCRTTRYCSSPDCENRD